MKSIEERYETVRFAALLPDLRTAFRGIKGKVSSGKIEKAIGKHLQGMDEYARSRLGRMLWEEAKETLDERTRLGVRYKYYELAQYLDPIVGGA